MARMSDQELGDIISRDLPGHRIVRRKGDEAELADAASDTPTEADEVSPDFDELRRKYLGDEGAGTTTTEAVAPAAPSVDAQAAAEESDTSENTDDEIVIVEKEASPDPFGHRARPKAVVVSGKEKRVVGYQG